MMEEMKAPEWVQETIERLEEKIGLRIDVYQGLNDKQKKQLEMDYSMYHVYVKRFKQYETPMYYGIQQFMIMNHFGKEYEK